MGTNKNLCVGRIIFLGHLEDYIARWPSAGAYFIRFGSFLLMSTRFHKSLIIIEDSKEEYHKMIITGLVIISIRY